MYRIGCQNLMEEVHRRVGAYYIQRAFYSGYFRGHGLKYQHVLLPNGLFGSVWGTSQTYNDVGVANMSGLEDYLFAVLEEDENGNLPCALADGIFNESAVVMTTKLREGADEDERRLYRRLASVRQPIELQYGNFSTNFNCSKIRMPSISSTRLRWHIALVLLVFCC